MRKTILLAASIAMFSTTLLATEPTFIPKNDLPKSSYNLNDVKKFKKANYGDPQNAIKLKLIPLLFNMVSLQYERALNEKMSVACDLNFLFYSSTIGAAGLSGGKVSYSGFGISPEFRFYPGEEALKGFFVGPYISYLGMSIKAEGMGSNGLAGTAEITGINAIGGGALLGWKWLIADAFSIETHIGANYLSLTIPSTVTVNYSNGTSDIQSGPDFSASGFLPTGGVSLGYAF